ncbi:MAG: hypothetical protein ACM3N9_06610 [Syntrophothermus sp.]
MNFFKRRNILKKTSFMDLIPVKVLDAELNEQGKVDIFVPRFKNDYLKRAFQTKKKGDFFVIHLDENGSLVWSAIDDRMTVEKLAETVYQTHPEKFKDQEDTNDRVRKFISLLYQERYISFRQIID